MIATRLATILAACVTAAPSTLLAADTLPPSVPADLAVPAGAQPFLAADAEGTQNYVCALGHGGFAWAFIGPQATLFDASGQQGLTHFLSPNPDEGGAARATWQDSSDTSRLFATAVASSSDPTFVTPGAIPWLLLRVVGDEAGPTGGLALSGATFIHRVDTAGGLAPATGCRSAKDIGKKALVPYAARYVFYR